MKLSVSIPNGKGKAFERELILCYVKKRINSQWER